MFILATGSVVFSCITGPGKISDREITLNTGKNLNGKIYTIRIFGEITSVVVSSMSNKSRKIELFSDDWRYDPRTTELVLLKEIPFTDYIVSIDGLKPDRQTFVLNELTDQEGLMVLIDDRLAIEGYDYFFDQTTCVLTFRDDLDIDSCEWLISYQTPFGGNSIGEWTPENQDRQSYLIAEHQKRYLDSWVDKQDKFWFFDSDTVPGRPPELVKRAATKEELQDMKDIPVSVWKIRMFSKNKKIFREVGFKTVIPEKIPVQSSNKTYSVWSKSIEEYVEKGTLIKKLHITYEQNLPDNESNLIDITTAPAGIITKERNLLISEETVNLGIDVCKIREWTMQSTSFDEKPKVLSITSWHWTIDGIDFYICGDTACEEDLENFILELIVLQKQ